MAELIQKTSLILWDEAATTNKMYFEALNGTLRDILRQMRRIVRHPFAGMAVVLGADFHVTEKQRVAEFADWVLNNGDGTHT